MPRASAVSNSVVEMRRVGTQRILDDDDRQVGMVSAKLLEPTTRCVAFAVILGAAVCVDNWLGSQGNDFFEVRVDQSGTQHLM